MKTAAHITKKKPDCQGTVPNSFWTTLPQHRTQQFHSSTQSAHLAPRSQHQKTHTIVYIHSTNVTHRHMHTGVEQETEMAKFDRYVYAQKAANPIFQDTTTSN